MAAVIITASVYPKCILFLPRDEKLVWQIFFLHFISCKQTLPLVGWSKKFLSVKYCDFLTPTNAVTENPQAAEKYY
jgi:hypothetical protein